MLTPQFLLPIHDELVVDLFAGGGGASTGIEQAIGRPVDIAVNHDPEAVALHEVNHPQTLHLVSDVFEVDPVEVTEGRPVSLLWASPDCFPAGTLILTDRGYRPIEEVEAGDRVLTHAGRYRQVTRTMTAVRPLVTVRGQGHPGISVSPEHPFYARIANNIWDNERRCYRRTLQPAEWVKASDLRTAGAPMNAAGGDLSFWATPCEFPALDVPNIGGRGMTIDERLLWLAGRYLGDGWSRLSECRAELVITCSRGEADELREKLSAWGRTGLRAGRDELAWHERDTATAHQFSTNHRGLVEWLRSEFGHRADAKGVPAWALGLPSPMRFALLEGYLSADGHTRTICGGEVVHCTTVSKTLAFGLRALGESLGYSVNVGGPYENRDTIEGRHINARPAWVVKWRRELQREQTVREGIHNWLRVRSIEDEDRTSVVYNLSVEEDESYVAEGIVVHNCTFHSKARGGKPFRDRRGANKRRALAGVVVRWARAVRPRMIALENVEEFQDWGPLDSSGKPCPKRRGDSFRRWVAQLRNAGYVVEWRELRGCDYGAPTIRKRLYLIARCDGLPIIWPQPTHGAPDSLPVRHRKLKPWRTAAECIDWSLPCPSIFERKRPLAEATCRRIAAGIMRYVVNAHDPFIVGVGQKHALVAAFLAKHYGGVVGSDLRQPIGTITAVDHHSLVTAELGTDHSAEVRAFLCAYYSADRDGQSVRDPMRTIPTRDRFGLVMVEGREYEIADIGLRMLQPRELYRAQGFPDEYIIDRGPDGKPLPKTAQVRMVGNSVCPPVARAIVAANVATEQAWRKQA